ncbi:flagellar hook-associated protein FlgK [Candidatus Magnetomonas plexicatena]|uniref:flagellar hook-associated protein FlgK n=1 Tax=Candidatus Magnetomonas plexicatena TaxID=2552947 RepID=UPI001C798628|nr:flagellar hook-associated protein FlgK [Nitrospirales bacterium LBB_01]
MSVGALFDIARSGLYASTAALDITGNNIANVNTPGYSKQDAALNSREPRYSTNGYIGQGVDFESVTRRVDNFVERQLLLGNNSVGKYTVQDDTYSSIENAYNEQNGNGLMDNITNYFNSWNEVAANPDTLEQRNILLTAGNELISNAKQIQTTFQKLSYSLGVELTADINRINDIAKSISVLNEQIANGEAGTKFKINDLRDQRGSLLTELSQLTKFDTIEDNSGRLTVIMGDRNLVGPNGVHELTQNRTSDQKDKLLIDNIDITDRITNGRLASVLQLRNNDQTGIPYTLSELRKIVGAITNQVNIIHSSGFGLQPTATDITVMNLTPDHTTAGSINSVSMSDFANLAPGDYQIKFTSPTTYDLYRNGSAVSTDNTYTGANTLDFNGVSVQFASAPASGDTYYVSARNKNFFNDLTPTASVKQSSTMGISSINIYDRTALTYNNYEVRFTDSTNYQLYDIQKGKITGSGSVLGGDTILIDGMQVKITGTPANHDILKVSPTDLAVTAGGVAITDTNDVAAASNSAGNYGDNSNALAMVALSQTNQTALINVTFNTYYTNIVTTQGGFAKSAKDNLTFTQNVQQQLQLQRDSVSGVSLDEEAMNLIQYQKAYQAAAKLVNVTDVMLTTLMSLVGTA